MTKVLKFLAVAGVATMTVFALQISSVFAEENGGAKGLEKKVEKMENRLEKGQDWVMNSVGESRAVMMKANGEFHLRGAEVVSVNATANTITAKLYGFTREVGVAGAKLRGTGGSITLSDIQVGDKLAAWGKFDESTRTLTVSEVRDLTLRRQDQAATRSRIEELLKMIKELQAKLRGSSN
ncbi:MAG: hypothetical protein AAB495_04235 [Patescibacteria group bacterium]